jgi:hypothetical protein
MENTLPPETMVTYPAKKDKESIDCQENIGEGVKLAHP